MEQSISEQEEEEDIITVDILDDIKEVEYIIENWPDNVSFKDVNEDNFILAIERWTELNEAKIADILIYNKLIEELRKESDPYTKKGWGQYEEVCLFELVKQEQKVDDLEYEIDFIYSKIHSAEIILESLHKQESTNEKISYIQNSAKTAVLHNGKEYAKMNVVDAYIKRMYNKLYIEDIKEEARRYKKEIQNK